MSALLFALLLAAQDAPQEAAAAEPAPAEAELPWPPGAPQDDYGLVAWCYGALSGYLDLHDRVLPEVTRIEGAFQRPGATLEGDMQVYADLRRQSLANMKVFAGAMQAAEKASLKPINARGAAAIARGRAAWAGASTLPVRNVAQQWMGWTLPVRCQPTAVKLEASARLLGRAFQANAAEDAPPEPAPPADPAAAAIPAADPPSEPAPATDPIGDAIAAPSLRTEPK